MTTIPLEIVDQVWERMGSASEKEAQHLAERMQEEQPALMVYLLAMEDNMDTGEEAGWLLYLGGIVFEVMTSQGNRLEMVEPDEIDAMEAENVATLQQLEEGSETDFAAHVLGLFKAYNQMPLLGSMLEALMSGNEDTPELAPEHTGMALLVIKTVIDCLDQQEDGEEDPADFSPPISLS